MGTTEHKTIAETRSWRDGWIAALLGASMALFDAAAPVRAAEPPACIGDCNGNGAVSVDDLVTGVMIALGSAPPSACAAMDANGDGIVTIDELIRAVEIALASCPVVSTPSASAAPTDTATAVAAPTDTATAGPDDTLTPSVALPPTPTPTPIPSSGTFCDLPGSVLFTGPGVAIVPGGGSGPDLSFMSLPQGFCVHFFANVGNIRELQFAPGGELFASSPTRFTTGNGQRGQSAIVILPDDDEDGLADATVTFLPNLPATVGLLFHDGFLYYQDDTRIMRLPYASGDRIPSGASEPVADITVYKSNLHWPKTLDAKDDGTIYVGNGGDEGERCDPTRPFRGGILALDGSPGGAQIARGFRNPISVRCARGHNMCFAIELARDYSTALGGREKLVPIREGDDWGFPCCGTKDLPYSDLMPVPDCSMVSAEIDSFLIGHTPFDLDFETGRWPEPWTHRAFVPLHGVYGTWQGASLIGIDFDTMAGTPLPGSNLSGMLTGALSLFASGWDNGIKTHGRPAVVAFAPDGRLFLGNDNNGDIVWIAPVGLRP